MTEGDQHPDGAVAGARGNGLSPAAPTPGLTVLVTGGAGYIGCVLVERLLERGYRVRVLDRMYLLGRRAARARARPGGAGGRRCPRHAGRCADGRRLRDPPGRALQRPDGRVRPRGQLADERARHRGARSRMHPRRDRAPRLRLLLLALRRAAARDAPRGDRDRAARRLRHLQALCRGAVAGAR